MSATDRPSYARPQPPANNLAVALAYIAKHPGRKLFPCVGSKSRPAIKNNLELASNDPAQLARWQKEHEPRGRIMWACSPRVSGIFCLDADMGPGKVGEASLDKLVREIGDDDFGSSILNTETNRTPSGGLHLIFEGEHKFHASDDPADFDKGRTGRHVDVPNYFMIPGQARADGKRYSVLKDIPAMPAPAALQLRVKPPQPERTRTYSADAVPLDLFVKMLKATPYTGGPAGLDDRHSYGGCVNFLMAAHEAAGGDEADYMEAVIDWCLDDPNPNWKEPTSREWVERRWCSFKSDAPNAVTRGSWFQVLKGLGRGDLIGDADAPGDFEAMRDDPSDFVAPANDNDVVEETPDGKPTRRNRLKGRSIVELMALPEPKWLLANMVPDGLFIVYGKPKRGKSFWALDLSLCVALGVPFHDEPVGKVGKVLYVAAEGGAASVRNRVLAWCKVHKVDPAALDGKWELIDTGIALNLPESVNEFLEVNRDGGKRALVILDTLARNTRGDENSQKDMSATIKGCDRIREVTGAAVGLVHHEGWSAKRIRGSSVLQGAPDAVIRIARGTDDMTTVIAEDMRESVAGKTQIFTLGEDGVLHKVAAGDVAKRQTGDKVLDILCELYESGGEPVPLKQWRDAVRSARLFDDTASGRGKWKRTVDAMVLAKRIKLGKGEKVTPTFKRDDLLDDAPITDFADDPITDDDAE
jgi:hypothetical protein